MNNYREKKERARMMHSALIVLGAVASVFLISFIFDLFQFEDFTDYSGPVQITFGSPDSLEELVTPVKEPTPKPAEPIEEVEPIVEPVVEPEIVEPAPEIVEPTPTKEVKPEPIPEPKPVEKKVTPKPEPVKPPEPVIQKGSENGNSHETSLESSSDAIGRRAYFPISQFMPLPETISESIYSLISGDTTGFGDDDYNRTAFKKFYSNSGGSYSLKKAVPLDERPELWDILDEAGYDMKKPEYKEKYSLKPVIIKFVINSNSNGSNAIKSAEITSKGGVPEIDEAVLHGFKQSTYSNATDESVTGRFKYSFN